MFNRSIFLTLAISATLPAAFGQAIDAHRTTPVAATATTVIPALVRYQGIDFESSGNAEKTVNFLIFKDEKGGEALWTETQTLSLDSVGRYEVYLGATSSSGLPPDLFGTGVARWLEVQIAGEIPGPRTLLTSVPYALKAADAATLGGLPASAFALAGTVGVASSQAKGVTPDATSSVTTTGGSANKVAKFSGTNTIVSSTLYDNGTDVGIGTTAPSATLTVAGTFAMNGASTLNGALNLNPTAAATSSAGKDSQQLKIYASAYNSSSKAAVDPHFVWQAEPTGNNTSSPGGTLNLLASPNSGGSVETGLYFNTNGTIHFATGQTFPAGTGGGSGTITGVTAGTGLTGGGTSGKVTLNVNTAAIPALGTNNTFTGSNTFVASINENTDVNIDNTNSNYGAVSPGLRFGSASGEGISSQRVSGGNNQYGLDFYTDYLSRMSIFANGNVNIGTTSFFSNGNLNVGTSQSNGVEFWIADNGQDNVLFQISSDEGLCQVDLMSNLACGGTISGGAKDFKIDHPLDPANKYLVHSSVESSEMLNIYSGNAKTDGSGSATVTLPDWFAAENGDFRYQLTVVGQQAQAWIAKKVGGGEFQIATNPTNVEVSWQITATRQDAYAKAHPLVVEAEKPSEERGLYQHPEFFGQPKEKGISWARKSNRAASAKGRSAANASTAKDVSITP